MTVNYSEHLMGSINVSKFNSLFSQQLSLLMCKYEKKEAKLNYCVTINNGCTQALWTAAKLTRTQCSAPRSKGM